MTGLVRVRSPLLTESRLMSFPPATEMFQFAGFASRAYGFSTGYPLPGGFPHSEIPGSKPARGSPGLFAACHVLHRLLAPRHPPDALLIARPFRARPKPRPQNPPRTGEGPARGRSFLVKTLRTPWKPRARAQGSRTHSLFTMSKNRSVAPRRPAPRLVEVNGIEPMTSCLQSRRSPN
jgi:hypothetical protein